MIAPNRQSQMEPNQIHANPLQPKPLQPNPIQPAPIQPAPIQPAPIQPNRIHLSRNKIGRASSLVGALAIALACILSAPNNFAFAEEEIFVAKPYVQLGNNPTYAAKDSEEILWIGTDADAKWQVETKIGSQEWHRSGAVVGHEIEKPANVANYLFRCKLENLPAGTSFRYRVLLDEKPVFEAQSQTRKKTDQPYRFAVFGDIGAGSKSENKIAFQCYSAKPDFIVMPGDLVYDSGLYSEYLKRYFPIYNAEAATPESGAPIIRSILTIGVLGNHDIALRGGINYTDLDRFPDALAYYLLWSQPLNGPLHGLAPSSAPPLGGAEAAQSYFRQAAGRAFPTMSNFSFDYGNSHWLALDGNYYTNWADPQLRKWVKEDLQKAKHAAWRFVTFHEPGFSVDIHHGKEQRMRLLSDIFQEEKVDVVFAGHAHDYQRSFPLRFKPKLQNGMPFMNPDGTVDGEMELDKNFDGQKNTRPNAPIYVVSGGGGANLYKVAPGESESKNDFMDKLNASTHSLTECEVKGTTLNIKQVSEDGDVIDSFQVTKQSTRQEPGRTSTGKQGQVGASRGK
jgi:acid phosphatase type 7